jgi:hypothetical protein
MQAPALANTDPADALERVAELRWIVPRRFDPKGESWLCVEGDGDEGQCTVVTVRSGQLTGQRVVRGRESERCAG